MRLKMAKNSIFAILLRKPWWVSLAVASTLSIVAMAMLPRHYMFYGLSAGFPFMIIAAVAAFRQLRAPSPARVSRTLDAVSAMSWRDFADAVEQGFQGDGFQVTRDPVPGADFEVAGGGRRLLVAGKRWKAANTGIEPLRALRAAADSREMGEAIYICIGQLTDQAWGFANTHRIHIMKEEGLAALLRNSPKIPKR